MAIDSALIKYYRCVTWAEGDSHGGDIDLTSEITGGDLSVFDDVTDAERVAGDVEYRKVYVRNENADTWAAILAWIETQTPAANSVIAINADDATTGDTQATAKLYTYYEPDSKEHANVQTIGDLAQNAYHAIWIRRTITAGGMGATSDAFTLGFGSS